MITALAMPDVLYFNGRFTTTDEPVLRVEDRGFQFADAIYEVFKFLGRRPLLLEPHFRRLEQSLALIEISTPWSWSEFEVVVRELLERTEFEDGIVYIQVSRGESERAHFYPENLTPTVIVYSRRLTFPDAGKKALGIKVISTPDLRWSHCDVKSVNLLANALAKKVAQRSGADEALLTNGGVVIEGASSSFFGVLDGVLMTHPLGSHILPGVVRDQTLVLARETGLEVRERPLLETELASLGEAFITSTTQGVMPVSAIDGRAVADGRRGPVTEKLQRLFDELERG